MSTLPITPHHAASARGDVPASHAETGQGPGTPVPTIPPTTVVGLGLVSLGLITAASGVPIGAAPLVLLAVAVAVGVSW